jgi:hypothetical protein
MMKKIVSKRALIQRINRKLKTHDEVLRVMSRSGRSWLDTGDYYIIDLQKNCIMSTHVDLAEYGKKLGVLAGYETLEQ